MIKKEEKTIVKILTAIGNENLNNVLKKENEFEILENDIFYREGILEFLEKNKKVDILILYEKLNGEINLINLIKNIKKINNEINIFFILENKNLELENLLKNENIKNIFYNDEININNFINKLKNTNINKEEKLVEEIKLLKNIINKKDEEILKYQNQNENINFNNKKIITVIGEELSGKSLIISNLQNVLKDEQYEEIKNFEFREININNFSEIEKVNNITYKFIIILETNYEKIKINKKIMDKLILNNKINLKKINIIFNKINKYSINKKIIKNIFKQFNIIGEINLNNYCNYLINKNNNYKNENKKLIKQYLKIINQIDK